MDYKPYLNSLKIKVKALLQKLKDLLKKKLSKPIEQPVVVAPQEPKQPGMFSPFPPSSPNTPLESRPVEVAPQLPENPRGQFGPFPEKPPVEVPRVDAPGVPATTVGSVSIEQKQFPAFGLTAAASIFSFEKDKIYVFQTPKIKSQCIAAFNGEGLTSDAKWEVSLSQIPGDFDLAKQHGVPGSFGQMVYPFYGKEQLTWVPFQNTMGVAYVPNQETWYLNFKADRSGQIYFQTSGT